MAKRIKPQIVPLRVPKEMREKIRSLAEKSHLSDADIMRMAIERGLGALDQFFTTPEKQAA
jgi:predicted DNA-binding protein